MEEELKSSSECFDGSYESENEFCVELGSNLIFSREEEPMNDPNYMLPFRLE